MAAIKITIRQKRIVYDTSISITSFEGETRNFIDEESNPETVLIHKIEALADLLGCTETEAERLIFERCETL